MFDPQGHRVEAPAPHAAESDAERPSLEPWVRDLLRTTFAPSDDAGRNDAGWNDAARNDAGWDDRTTDGSGECREPTYRPPPPPRRTRSRVARDAAARAGDDLRDPVTGARPQPASAFADDPPF